MIDDSTVSVQNSVHKLRGWLLFYFHGFGVSLTRPTRFLDRAMLIGGKIIDHAMDIALPACTVCYYGGASSLYGVVDGQCKLA